MVEIVQGSVHIVQEFNALQECLRDWYFTCFFIGTCIFASFYAVLWWMCGLGMAAWKQRYGQRHPTEHDDDEPLPYGFDFMDDDHVQFEDMPASDPSQQQPPPPQHQEDPDHGPREEQEHAYGAETTTHVARETLASTTTNEGTATGTSVPTSDSRRRHPMHHRYHEYEYYDGEDENDWEDL